MDITFTFGNSLSDVSTHRNKGKSIIAFPENYTVIDLETTGLSPDYDEIIEIAGIRVRNNHVSETFQSLVKPSFEIDEFITELTGITNKMLETAPMPNEIFPQFLDFIGDDIVVGHNIGFDINFLYDNLKNICDYEFKNDHINTLRISHKVLPNLKHHRLSDICDALEVIDTTFHRALGDCQATQSCYSIMHNLVREKYSSDEEFISLYKKSKTHPNIDLRSITSDGTDFDESHPLYNKVCVFTGELEKMKRAEAAQIVVNCGGSCGNNVTKKTNYLILGNNDYCKTIKDGKSSKQKKAEQYKLDGLDIEIIPENVFYDMINFTDVFLDDNV